MFVYRTKCALYKQIEGEDVNNEVNTLYYNDNVKKHYLQ